MTWLKTVLTMLLAAVWLLASSHVLLEQVGLIHQGHPHVDHASDGYACDSSGSPEHHADNHDAADGLCLTPGSKAQVPTPALWKEQGWFATPFGVVSFGAGFVSPHCSLSPTGVAPPELSHHWQFSRRAAPSARAPSLTS